MDVIPRTWGKQTIIFVLTIGDVGRSGPEEKYVKKATQEMARIEERMAKDAVRICGPNPVPAVLMKTYVNMVLDWVVKHRQSN